MNFGCQTGGFQFPHHRQDLFVTGKLLKHTLTAMKVYQYRGIEFLYRDLETFINNQFFAPNFEKLNDPFETNINETISVTLKAINKLFYFNTSI